jgi:hypothetical protein
MTPACEVIKEEKNFTLIKIFKIEYLSSHYVIMFTLYLPGTELGIICH